MSDSYLLPVLLSVIILLAGSYALFTTGLLFFWGKIKTNTASDISQIFISVIVPVRNEESNIGLLLKDLEAQSLPTTNFEVLIMDDSSTDSTAKIVREFASGSTCNIQLISLPNIPTTSPKKRAIETAIQVAKGNLIVTTDGDCRVQPGWLSAIASCYQATKARLISAPVTFTAETSLTDHLQTVEFSSLIGSGASAIAAGYPSMCNGANLTYEKETFIAVGGFEGVKHIASGDDEFLMHKVAAQYPGSVHFLKNPEAVVRTAPHKKWSDFFRQRKRWASKWKHYKSKTPLILAVYVFSCNFSLILSLLLWCFGLMETPLFLGILAAKCIPEWIFLGTILRFLDKTKSILYIPLTQVIYPFYVCFFGLAAQKPTYEWKGRKLV